MPGQNLHEIRGQRRAAGYSLLSALGEGRLTRRRALVVGGALVGTDMAGPILAPERHSAAASSGGQTRKHFIAAEEVDRDYAASGKGLITGEPFSEAAQVFTEPGPNRIGHVCRKALYHAFTDDAFTTRVAADPRWEHLGILGPVIHAEVGDTIVVHFRDNTMMPSSLGQPTPAPGRFLSVLARPCTIQVRSSGCTTSMSTSPATPTLG